MSRTLTFPLLVLAAAGCGYTAGYDLQRQGVRTVAVEVVENATLRQRLEIPITTELHKALPIHAGLRAAPRAQADTTLEVEIVEIRGRSLEQGAAANPVREGALLYTVRAVLRDAGSGRVLRDRLITDRVEFRRPIGENERSAVQEASYDIARKIALALEADF